MITPEEYVADAHRGVTRCPNCGHDSITAWALENEHCDFVSQQATCDRCEATWTECFALTGYTDLEVSDDDD